MPEINLLQNQLNDQTNNWQKSGKALIVVLVLVIIAEAVGGGAFYMLNQTAQENKQSVDQQNATLQQEITKLQEDLKDATGFQAQTKNIATLLETHVVWNQIIQEVADTAYRNSRYMSLSADTTGKVHIEGLVSNYTDLGKMLLSLETSDNFSGVKLLSSAPGSGAQAGILYSVEVLAKQSIFLAQD